MTPEQLAWLAGVVDSLGIVRVRRVGDSDLPGVFIHTPHLELLQRVAEITGTKVTIVERRYSKAGCSEHCSEKHLHVKSRSGRWSITGARASIVLRAILPYLEVHGDEVRQVIEATEGAPFKIATVRKMSKLGWPVPE